MSTVLIALLNTTLERRGYGEGYQFSKQELSSLSSWWMRPFNRFFEMVLNDLPEGSQLSRSGLA